MLVQYIVFHKNNAYLWIKIVNYLFYLASEKVIFKTIKIKQKFYFNLEEIFKKSRKYKKKLYWRDFIYFSIHKPAINYWKLKLIKANLTLTKISNMYFINFWTFNLIV